MKRSVCQVEIELKLARETWPALSSASEDALRNLIERYCFSVKFGDIKLLEGNWYVTHSGLLRLSRRKRCAGIQVSPVSEFCDPALNRWAFQATVYRSSRCRGFVGFGDADASNVSALVHGAEMRVAETRAVNRALRKAYGIGLCSVEEIGSRNYAPADAGDSRKIPQATTESRTNARTLRDRLCHLIRQHRLDPNLVKAYSADFCGVKAIRDASREQVENFVKHLSEWAEKDRSALMCQLNAYLPHKEGAA